MAEEVVEQNEVQRTSLQSPKKTTNDKKKKPVCRFYAKSGRCKFEEKCRFTHSSKESTDTNPSQTQYNIVDTATQSSTEIQSTAIQSSHDGDMKTNPKVCKYYKTRGGCVRGSACKFSHCNNQRDAQVKKVTATLEKMSLLGVEELNTLRTRELEQLLRRFGRDKATQVQDGGPGTVFIINFTPSDPDWPFDIESLLLTVTFPDEYPKQMFNTGLSENQNLPLELVRCVNQEIIKWIAKEQQTRNKKETVDLPFRPFLRWLDRNIEKLFILAAKQMKKNEQHSVSSSTSKQCCDSIERSHSEEETACKTSQCTGIQWNNEGCLRTSDSENADPCKTNMHGRHKPNHLRKPSKPHTHSTPDRKDLLLSDFLVVKNKGSKVKVACNSKPHHHGNSFQNPKNEHIIFVSQESSEPVVPDGHDADSKDLSGDDVIESISWGDIMTDDDDLQVSTQHNGAGDKPRGTEVRIRGLELFENTSTLRARSLALTMECDKCKTKFDTKVDNTRACAVRCERCTSVIKLGFRPSIIHQYSTCTLGYLDLQGCHPFDLVMADMSLVAGCLACSSETLIKGTQYGSNQAWCSKCHQKLKFEIESVRFFQLMPSSLLSDNSDGHLPMPKRKPKGPGLKEGFPLPDKGTCAHYKKSYRWLRFPCCGKCYPCDVCHDEQESHEMKYATRMVCGFCSKEQTYSQGVCMACGSAITRGKTSHWEGGKGCRNRTLMSKGDDKKFKNTKKTTSRKSQVKAGSGNNTK